ncbi:MAG: beta-N-acetylhexosaminidase [Rhodothermales bacterium]|jgi:beta-N-acetylhexosaminidase
MRGLTKPDTLRERAAQLIVPRLGSNMPPAVSVADDLQRAERLLEEVPVGGFVLFRGSMESSPAALASLQDISKTPLLIASDLERGAGQQLSGGVVFPHAMAFGHAGSDRRQMVNDAACQTAAEARHAGVHWIFGPVADIHSNPLNPIISTRAFGSDPDECVDLTVAFVQGCLEGGALSTAKHFPGHGDTDTDSHDALPMVSRSARVLRSLELAPFRAAIAAGVDSVMTAHVAYPALDPSCVPATFSPMILRDLLRDEMGFRGVVVSDSLLMGAAGEAVSARAHKLVQAGVDVLLDISHPALALSALLEAVADGSMKEELIQEAFERIWAMKSKVFGLAPGPVGDGRALAAKVATAAVQVAGDLDGVLAGPGPVPLVVVRPHTDYPDPTRADSAALFDAASDQFEVYSVGPDTTEEAYQDLTKRIVTSGRCVLALVVKPAAWHKFGLLPRQIEFARKVIENAETAVCCLGSPDSARDLPKPRATVLAFSDVEASVRAVAHLLASGGR